MHNFHQFNKRYKFFCHLCIYFLKSAQNDGRGDENERGRKETIFSVKSKKHDEKALVLTGSLYL